MLQGGVCGYGHPGRRASPDLRIREHRITPEGDAARLVVEERGLPIDDAPDHAAGWQVHLEDLGAALAGRPTSDWGARRKQLIPAYR
jgi:hypothetical protein